MKKASLLVVLLLLVSVMPVYGTGVYLEDDNAILVTNPGTIGSSGWVEFSLTSKKYTGQIDSVWGFNVLEARPRRAEIWKNYTHDLYRYVWANVSRWVMVSDITGYAQITFEEWAGQPGRMGNMHNPTFYEVNGTIMEDPETLYMGVQSWSGDMALLNVSYLDDGTIREEYQETYPDWKPVSPDYQVIDRDFAGMNRWYALRNISVEAGETYKLRIWLDVPFRGLERSQGKYAWGIKRSTDTLQEAIASGRFYFIDPWWDIQWSHRVQLTFNNSASSENLTDFPVMVYLDSTRIDWGFIQNDGDDIRFTDSDDTTLLEYEIEDFDYSGSEAYLWVRVPQIDNGSITDHIHLYYGNPGASSGENITGTWVSDYVMVQHMVDETNATILDSTQYDNDGAKLAANEPIESEGVIYEAQNFDGVNDYLLVNDDDTLDLTTTLTVEMWVEIDKLPGAAPNDWGTILLKDDFGRSYGYLLHNDGELRWYQNGMSVSPIIFITNFVADTRYYLAVTLNTTVTTLYVNGTLDREQLGLVGAINVNAFHIYMGKNTVGGTYLFNGTIDEVRISNSSHSGDWIEVQYLSMTDALITYGSWELEPINLLVRVLTQGGTAIVGVSATTNGTITDYEITNATGWASLDVEYGNNTLTLVQAGYHNYLSTMLLEDNTTLIVAMIPDTELAGMGILPILVGFVALVVILAARRRR